MATTKPIGLYAIKYYLQRIREFLENDKKTLSFPHISLPLQDVLVKIVNENTGFIHKDPQFSDEVKIEAAKLTAAIEAHTNFALTYEFVDGKHGDNVLVYKKMEVINTLKPIPPLRQPGEGKVSKRPDSLITTPFKIQCLNLTARFVKDDSVLFMRYPPMEPCQAEFLMSILLPGKEGRTEQTDIGYGYRSMYAPLWESMKLFSLKYNYRIEYETGLDTTKCVVFEKIPKHRPKIKEPEIIKAAEPTPIILYDSMSSTSVTSSTAAPPKPKTRTPKQSGVRNKTQKLVKKVERLILSKSLTEEFIHESLERISVFMYDEQQGSLVISNTHHNEQYFLEHVEALCNDDMTYMLFTSPCQLRLGEIRRCISKKMLYQVRVLKKPGGKKVNKYKDVMFEKLGHYPTKDLRTERENMIKNPDSTTKLTAPLTSDAQEQLFRFKEIRDDVIKTSGTNYIPKRLQEIATFLTKENKEFTLSFRRMNDGQALFIKHVHILSKFSEGYSLFCEESQKLLRKIKENAENFKVKFAWHIDETVENLRLTNIIIKKTPIAGVKVKKEVCKEVDQENFTNAANLAKLNTKSHASIAKLYFDCRQVMKEQEKMLPKRSRSLSGDRRSRRNTEDIGSKQAIRPRGSSAHRHVSIKEKLREGLNQPVQSERGLKIMQSMGWRGGALGLRGDGIVEPIMPAIDIAYRAGLGHVPKPKPKKVPTPKRAKPPKPKPKLIQLATPEPHPPADLFPKGILPVASLSQSLVPPGIYPTGSYPDEPKMVYMNSDYKFKVLKSIYEILTTDMDAVHFVCAVAEEPKKTFKFIKHTIDCLNRRIKVCLQDLAHQTDLVLVIEAIMKNSQDLFLRIDKKSDLNVLVETCYWNSTTRKPECRRDITTENMQQHKTTATRKQDKATATREQVKTIAIREQDKATATREQDKKTATREQDKTTVMETTATGRCWYPKVALVTQTDSTIEARDKLLTAITKHQKIDDKFAKNSTDPTPLELKTLTRQKTLKNNQAPTKLKTSVSNSLQRIPTNNERQTEITTADNTKTTPQNDMESILHRLSLQDSPKIQEANAIAQKKQKIKMTTPKLKKTIARKPTEFRTSFTETPEDLLKLVFYYLQCIPRDVPLMNKIRNNREDEIARNPHKLLANAKKSLQSKSITQVIQEMKSQIPKIVQKDINIQTQNKVVDEKEEPKKLSKNSRYKKRKKLKMKIKNQRKLEKAMAKKLNEAEPPNLHIPQEFDNLKQYYSHKTPTTTTDTHTTTTANHNLQVTTIETPKSQSVMLLEKLPANNNYSTTNKNVPADVTKDVTLVTNNRAPAQAQNIVVTVKNEPRAVALNEITGNIPIPDNGNGETSAKICNTDIIDNRTGNTEIICNDNTRNKTNAGVSAKVDNKTTQNEPNLSKTDKREFIDLNEKEIVTYIMPLECITTIEPDNILNANAEIENQTDNNTNQTDTSNNTDKSNTLQIDNSNTDGSDTLQIDNCNTDGSDTLQIDNTDNKLPDYDDTEDCEVIFDDCTSVIEIASEDEDNLLLSEEDTNQDNADLDKDRNRNETEVPLSFEKSILALENAISIDSMKITVKIEKEEIDSDVIRVRKRSSVDSLETDPIKKSKLLSEFKKLYILPQNYPQSLIDKEKAREIQTSILQAIDYTNEHLPLLSCQGIQNGGLIYSCQDEKSVDFMEELIKTIDTLKIVYEFDVKQKNSHKMAFRINSFVEESANKILNRLELYNKGLPATKWGVVKKEQYGDFTVIYVEMDECSFDYVSNANFVLYAGNDCARFTIVWD